MADSCKISNQTSPAGSSTPSSRSSSAKLLRTPRSGMRTSSKLKQAFKSPYRPKPTESSPPLLSTEEKIASLKKKIESLDEEIKLMQKEYDVGELQDHIDKLHEYNDIKDAGQLILGKLAEIEGKTTRALYDEFGLDNDD